MGQKESHHQRIGQTTRREKYTIPPSQTKTDYPQTSGFSDKTSADVASFAVICALDFGTSYSGYAFGFRQEHTEEPDKIFMNKNWGENLSMQSYKTPTCVLTGPGDKFVGFGYEAEEKYGHFLAEERKKHHLYRHFKMSLNREKVERHHKLEAIDGHKMPALNIFALAIEYLKDHFLEALKKQVASEPEASMIRWVITVPAIWSEAAKQFMREAALKAGCINSKFSHNLVLALEPEAASLHSRTLPVNTFVAHRTGGKVGFEIGTQYIIVDAGGGTTDITVHKIISKKHMEEIYTPSGNAWGSTQIDKKFEKLLGQIFGNDFINFLKSDHPYEWLSLMLKFEKTKKLLSLEKKDCVVEMSYNIIQLLKEKKKRKIHQVIEEHSHDLGVSFTGGFLRLKYKTALELVMPVVTNIVDHVTKMVEKPSLGQVSALLLVGGFGESSILKAELEKRVSQHGIRIIVPGEAQLAVLKGAVTYGHDERAISSRIMKYTFGVDMEPRFDYRKHRSDKKKVGTEYCADVFQVYVTKGEAKRAGESISKKFFPRIADQPTMSFDIFYTKKSQLDEVEYVDSDHFSRAGGLTVHMPIRKGGMKREVQVDFFFGMTEITVMAKDVTSGEVAETTVDMLFDF